MAISPSTWPYQHWPVISTLAMYNLNWPCIISLAMYNLNWPCPCTCQLAMSLYLSTGHVLYLSTGNILNMAISWTWPYDTVPGHGHMTLYWPYDTVLAMAQVTDRNHAKLRVLWPYRVLPGYTPPPYHCSYHPGYTRTHAPSPPVCAPVVHGAVDGYVIFNS